MLLCLGHMHGHLSTARQVNVLYSTVDHSEYMLSTMISKRFMEILACFYQICTRGATEVTGKQRMFEDGLRLLTPPMDSLPINIRIFVFCGRDALFQ